uniref:Uncharacterized protein n=1 Tax=Anopheles quadriannulatus TaxID=34691 RepID=A0A182XP15_ANOQN
MAFAGNIQTGRKNCASTQFPFKFSAEQAAGLVEDILRRDQLREVYKEKLSRILTKNANEQLETIHRQEEERKQLRKRKNYYMAKETGQDPQYSLQRTDDVVTFWSYRGRRNANHRRNNDFTKPQEDKLDVQFE